MTNRQLSLVARVIMTAWLTIGLCCFGAYLMTHEPWLIIMDAICMGVATAAALCDLLLRAIGRLESDLKGRA